MGGIVSGITDMFTGGGDEQQQTTQTSTTEIPSWLTKDWQDVYTKAQSATSGTNVAPLSSNIQSAINLAGTGIGDTSGYTTSAKNMLDTYSTSLGDMSSLITQYQNPYTQGVLNTSLAKLQEEYDQQMKANAAKAVGTGAFGGSQYGVQNALSLDKYLENVGDTTSKVMAEGYESAYNKAQDYLKNLTGGATAYETAATNLSDLSKTDISNLLTTGQTEQEYAQSKLDEPKDDVTFLATMLGAMPYGTTSTQFSNAEKSTGNDMSNLLGTAMSLYSLFGSDKRLKKNIKFIKNVKGINIYEFEYKKDWLPKGKFIGVMAQEIKSIIKDAAVMMKNGYYAVNYTKVKQYLGV